VSKRTNKRKLRAKKKANHGKKPNCGRGWRLLGDPSGRRPV